MKKIIIISILSLLITSCAAPYSTYDYTPRYVHYPYTYNPTKVIVVKQKHHKHKNKHKNKHKSNKRHVKVKINKKR